MTSILDTVTQTSIISGGITFTGLGSGTDFTEMVDSLVEIESINKTRLEAWMSTWESKVEVINALNERLAAIEEAAAAMDTLAEFLVRAASSSSSSIVSATATSEAALGAYNIEVGADVKQVLQSAGLADTGTSAVGGAGGTLWFEIDGVSYQVAINAGDTLNDVVDALNNNVLDADGAAVDSPVTAAVVDDGTDSNPYHLTITSNTGGNAGRVIITQNPTDLAMDDKNFVLQDTSGWGVASNEPAITLVGQFTGDKADAEHRTYTCTVSNPAGTYTVGTDEITLQVTRSTDASTFNVTIPADYSYGDSIELEDGMYIQLEAGQVDSGDSFVIRAHSDDIDDAETSDWTGPNITTSGNYLGSASKTYTFTAMGSGTLVDGGGGDTVTLRWTDSLGNTGTVTVDDSATAVEVEEGVFVQLDDSAAIAEGDTFQINVFAAVKQQGQDQGLAQVTRLVHEGFTDDVSSAVTDTDATFSFTYGGKQVDIEVPEGTTLSQLVNLINSDENNPGVTASIINDGQGLPTSYRLVLTGQDPGAQNQISSVTHDFTGSGFSNGGGVGGGFDVTQLATNSMVKVDGFPSGEDEWLQRDSNSVTDVVNGVALSLHSAGDATITVSVDTSKVASQVEALVNAINYTLEYIHEQTYYDPDGEETGLMIGNYSFQIVESRLKSLLASSVEGLDSDTDPYVLLSQIGIESDPDDDGLYSIDESALWTALNTDPDAVANLFVSNDTTGVDGMASLLYDEMEAMTDSETGILVVLANNYDDIINNIQDKIDYEENRLELYRERQLERFARLEATLSELESQGKAISSQIEQMNNSNNK